MKDYRQLLLANRAWADEHTAERADFFERQVQGQKPQFLWIGCSDSRVAPEQMTMTPPGGMFIHRNVANLVHEDDVNLLSVVQYAVTVLKVRHVIICGHYGCGGVRAALDGGTSGPVHDWLENARTVYCDHAHEVDAMGDADARANRLVELNVRDQLVRLAQLETIRQAFAEGQELFLHGWVYDMRDGLIKPLMEIDRETVLEEVGRPERVLV
ncbi:carbonic anhydrase [Sphingomonas sp. G-3-2-10]|jgi:carbonic anhydrase|uniref:carbonic anhydrase n=1 Tax=Sphingomonas sp. G-3-2-10 TaxID=2728838 RepID=UPI00146B90B8|nr:carbonic anhydrase [Sphingomonas sp. G-3-2-10]NML04614.1 carbonic anhydrase [Sphingomonas sp. G-3-2-10]